MAQLDLKEDFKIEENGTHYLLPQYYVENGVGLQRAGVLLEVKFVRGSKDESEDISKSRGTLHEHLLAMMIHDLKYKNSLVPSRETTNAIQELEVALFWLRQRQVLRQERGVSGTYKK